MTERVTSTSLVTLHYRIATEDGDERVSTFRFTPATLQLGNHELTPGMEACLDGLEVGTHKTFVLAPEQAFGPRNPKMVTRVPRDALPPKAEPKLLEPITFPAADGAGYAGVVLEMDEASVLLDFNHPLAGKTIRFEVQIIGIS